MLLSETAALRPGLTKPCSANVTHGELPDGSPAGPLVLHRAKQAGEAPGDPGLMHNAVGYSCAPSRMDRGTANNRLCDKGLFV